MSGRGWRVVLGVLWCLSVGRASAETLAFRLDGEAFTRVQAAASPRGDRLLEFVREDENFESWTKLVALRQQPVAGVIEPRRAAETMANMLRLRYPKAAVKVFANEKKNEASVEFVAASDDKEIVEYNLFRYSPASDAKSVVSLQLAYRGVGSGIAESPAFQRLRVEWVVQSAAFDMERARLALAQVR